MALSFSLSSSHFPLLLCFPSPFFSPPFLLYLRFLTVREKALEHLKNVLETLLRDENPLIQFGAVSIFEEGMDQDTSVLQVTYTVHAFVQDARSLHASIAARVQAFLEKLLSEIRPGPSDVFAGVNSIRQFDLTIAEPSSATDNSTSAFPVWIAAVIAAIGALLIIVLIVVVVVRRKRDRAVASSSAPRAVTSFESKQDLNESGKREVERCNKGQSAG
jgi:hypothetical protein